MRVPGGYTHSIFHIGLVRGQQSALEMECSLGLPDAKSSLPCIRACSSMLSGQLHAIIELQTRLLETLKLVVTNGNTAEIGSNIVSITEVSA